MFLNLRATASSGDQRHRKEEHLLLIPMQMSSLFGWLGQIISYTWPYLTCSVCTWRQNSLFRGNLVMRHKPQTVIPWNWCSSLL